MQPELNDPSRSSTPAHGIAWIFSSLDHSYPFCGYVLWLADINEMASLYDDEICYLMSHFLHVNSFIDRANRILGSTRNVEKRKG